MITVGKTSTPSKISPTHGAPKKYDKVGQSWTNLPSFQYIYTKIQAKKTGYNNSIFIREVLISSLVINEANKLSLKDFPNKNKDISRVILSKTVPIADFFVALLTSSNYR